MTTTRKIRLNTPARKLVVTAAAMLLATAYISLATRQCIASWLGDRHELASLKRAAKLDAANAEYRSRLGRYYERELRDPSAALGYYQAAVELNPHVAQYWLDVADAYRVLGDVTKQSTALESAIQADPMTPDVAWDAGSVYLSRGENEKALREFAVVITNDPYMADSAMQLCWRIEPDVDGLLRDVIPQRADAYITFLALLESKHETAGTMKVWDALMQTRESFELRHSFDYIRYLIQNKEVDEAELVWQQTVSRFGLNAYLPSSGNLLVNGGFNLDVLNAGFDWQYQKQPGVGLTLDPNNFHGGRRSLLITFDGPRINEAGIFQFVAVQPNTTYEFSAYYKNGETEGAGGPHFTIEDAYNQSVYYESEELKDAGFWKSVGGEFTSGPDCKLVVLHIRRLPAGSPMRGKLWVGDFHLSRKQS